MEYFKISDWLRIWVGEWQDMEMPDDKEIMDQIYENHFKPMNQVRGNLGHALKVDAGYRSTTWELEHGRDGSSQHCYRPNGFGKRGATDITTWYGGHYRELADALIASPYKRICWYPEGHFFHCDWKAEERQLFVNGDDGWVYIPAEDWPEVYKF